MKRIIYLILISMSVLIFSCETKTDIGYDLLPKDDILDLNIIDTTSIEVYTLLMDSIKTNNVNTLLLGEYIDPIFGKTSASFVCEYKLAQEPFLKTSNIIDSAILTLVLDPEINSFYGNTGSDQLISVYRLENKLEDTINYYSDHNPDELSIGARIGYKKVYTPNNTDFNIYNPNNNDSSINIKLDQAFAQEFLELPSLGDDLDSLFKVFLKGVYIKSEVQNSDGALIKISITPESLITIYSDTADFKVTSDHSSNVRFNMFEHDYSSTTFYSQIDVETGLQDSVAYVQSMGGLRTKIKFPFIENLNDLGDIVIYRAELVINTAPSAITDDASFPAIDDMHLAGYDPENEYYLLPEYTSGIGYVGVAINEGSYKFDIGGYIRDILDGNIENNGLLLFAYSGSTNFGRSVITTGNHSDRMKLFISYAKL